MIHQATPTRSTLSLCRQIFPARMFFSLFHTEPHLLSLHFLSQDTALPRTNPSGRPISLRGNSSRTHKGMIGAVPCPQRPNLWSCTHFPSPQPTSLSTSCQNAGDSEVYMSLGSTLSALEPQIHFYKEKHKTPEKTGGSENG